MAELRNDPVDRVTAPHVVEANAYSALVAVLSVVLAIGVVLALGVLQRRIGTRAPWLTTRSRDGSRWTPLLVLLIGAVILANALFWLAVLTIRLVD